MTTIENCSLTDNMANDMAKQTPIEKDATKLKRELAQAWKDIETLPITEIGARNAGVLEYMRHWEGRAECAEAQLAIAQAELSIKVETIGNLANQLAAAQAQLKVMREALENAEGALDESGMYQDYPVTYDLVLQALNQPTDDSALREILKAERERCAKTIETLAPQTFIPGCDIYLIPPSPIECAAAIRAMEQTE